jgi:GT2 family glycosyltransferase
MQPKVEFVVVNWNQRELTVACLASLYQQDYANFAVTLVDNGSQDDTLSVVKQTFADVTIIANGRNAGIAAANNVGIRHALDNGADYVFLLNNDTIVDPSMLTKLIAVGESNTDLGMVGPVMLYYDKPQLIWCAGNLIDWKTGSTMRLYAEHDAIVMEGRTAYEVDFITSCAVCIKRTVFETVGLMDERYFIYYDETDWFARASAAGWRTLVIPGARMWHKVSATMGESTPTTDYYMTRNKLLFLSKNLSGFPRLLAVTKASARTGLAVLAYSVKSDEGKRRGNRNAKLLGVRDAAIHRWGQMQPDVARMCSTRKQ